MGKVQSDKTKVINFTSRKGNLSAGNPKRI